MKILELNFCIRKIKERLVEIEKYKTSFSSILHKGQCVKYSTDVFLYFSRNTTSETTSIQMKRCWMPQNIF